MMAGHGQKLTRKREQAVVALLAESSIVAAAARAGIGEATLGRWLRDPAFQATYAVASRQLVAEVVADLQRVGRKAVEALRDNLDGGTPASRNQAALGLLDRLVRATELADLAERIVALEEQERRREAEARRKGAR